MSFSKKVFALLCSSLSFYNVATQTVNPDVNTLNFALTLEQMEVAFFTGGYNAFNASAYVAAGYPQSTFTYITYILAHEQAHVAALKSTIVALGGVPNPPCATYPFTPSFYTSPTQFLTTAQAIESVGVQAYTGATNTLTTPAVIQAGATIAAIEARHAIFLSTLLNAGNPNIGSAAPAYDTPVPPTSIFATAESLGFIGGCPTSALSFVSNIMQRPAIPTNYMVNANSMITVGQNDIDALQYALTLENLENAFYTMYVGQPGGAAGIYGAADFVGYPTGTFNYFQLIAAHEQSHVNTINATLISLGATPVVPCTYNFGSKVTSVDSFVSIAAVLEQTGSTAYASAINSFTNTQLQQVAASIATIESRQSQFINYAIYSKFPNATTTVGSAIPNAGSSFEATMTPSAVFAAVAATGFQVSCPSTQPPLPVVSQPLSMSTSSTGTHVGHAVHQQTVLNVQTLMMIIITGVVAARKFMQ